MIAERNHTLDTNIQPLPAKRRLKIAERCDTEFHARDTSGKRSSHDITCVVIHCTEGYTARGAAQYFEFGPAGQVGSTQLVVDDKECYRDVGDLVTCWGAPPLNDNGLHIEQAGFTTFTRLVWSKKHRQTIRRTAYKVAAWCVKYDIPVRFLRTADLPSDPSKTRGITAHMFVSEKWHQSTHSDPGDNYPFRLFMLLVRRYVKRIVRKAK